MTDRMGYASRQIYYPEGTWNSDSGITVGHILPLADISAYRDSSDPIEVPIFMGDGLLPYDVVSGLVMAGGAIPLALEYEFMGYPLKSFFGANGYTRPGAGTNKLHEFAIATAVGSQPGASFQLQSEWLEGTPVYLRGRGNRITGLSWEGAASGFARWVMDVVGSGSMTETDLGGTKTDNGFAASSYTDGSLKYTSGGTTTTLADVTALRCRLFNGGSRREAFYNAGIAGAINTGKINGEIELGLAMLSGGTGPSADLNFYNDAVNAVDVDIDLVQANAPVGAGTATKFVRYQFSAIRLIRMAPTVGGQPGIVYSQRAILRRSDNAKTAGTYLLPTAGTFNIGAGNNKLGIKPDGGATQEITLTQGAARTVAQVVADINGTLTGATAEAYLGRYVRITSSTKGSSSSIQIDTGVTNTAHALFGADNVARAGRSNCPVRIELFNAKTSDF